MKNMGLALSRLWTTGPKKLGMETRLERKQCFFVCAPRETLPEYVHLPVWNTVEKNVALGWFVNLDKITRK